MSTRANIIIEDKYGARLYFYRHSDGYPEGTLPTLTKFLNLVKDGTIRNNTSQAAGWLIFIGAVEYREYNPTIFDAKDPGEINPKDWKVGSYEPTIGLHGDIDYLYIVDLATKEITTHHSDDIPEKYQEQEETEDQP